MIYYYIALVWTKVAIQRMDLTILLKKPSICPENAGTIESLSQK